MSVQVEAVPFPWQVTVIDVEGSDTVAFVKDKVRAMGGLPPGAYICVIVKLGKALSIEVDIEDSDTIDEVKAKIPNQEGIRKDEYTLAFDAFSGRHHCKITVNRISGASFEVEVAYEDVIDQVKAKIQRQKGIPQDQQQLVFDGVLLDDDCTLRSYKVKNGSTLSLIAQSPPMDEDP